MAGEAVLERDDAQWAYPGYNGMSRRRLRVWRHSAGRVVAVVTERATDEGTSITNAAEAVCLALEREYPGDMVLVVEHYPDSAEGSRYSTVTLDGQMRPVWRHLDDKQARAMLPGLEEPQTC